MCKPNKTILPSAGGFQKILSTATGVLALGLLCSLPVSRASAQSSVPCTTCPDNATKPAVGSSIGLSVLRPPGSTNKVDVTRGIIGSCETLIIDANVSYNAFGAGGGGGGFS